MRGPKRWRPEKRIFIAKNLVRQVSHARPVPSCAEHMGDDKLISEWFDSSHCVVFMVVGLLENH